jgi:hypothetical protein
MEGNWTNSVICVHHDHLRDVSCPLILYFNKLSAASPFETSLGGSLFLLLSAEGDHA